MKPTHYTTPGSRKTTAGQVAGWAQALTSLHARIAKRFARSEPRRRALSYLQGLMSSIERKNGWQLAEQARETTPYGMQRLLARAVWDESLVRDDVRTYVLEHLASPHGILVVDETGFPKQGKKSAGVKKQYCGSTGKVENCQVGVFLAYVSAWGHALIDRELYLPDDWTDDRQRCLEAGIPETVGFQTKCELARQMIERVERAQIPVSWVVADTVYGNNEALRLWLEAHGYQHVLAVACDEQVNILTEAGRKRLEVRQVEALLLQEKDWQRLSMSEGTKGPRLFDWAVLAILHQGVADGCHWLLIRRPVDDPQKKTYYLVWAPPATTLSEMVKILGARWRIEEIFQAAKAMGLDDYEVRNWIGWYRHITLVMLAHAFLTVICAQEKEAPLATPALQATACARPADEPLPDFSDEPLGEDPSESRRVGSLPPSSDSPSPLIKQVQAPLTVPGVRRLLGRLIWPLASGSEFVLAWSDWRREHRSTACYYHTKRRLQAG